MRAEIVAYMIYLEGPEHSEYVMHVPWPFFCRILCRKAQIVGANLKGGSEDFHREGGKTKEQQTLIHAIS